jgi:hypothetical protein
VSTDGQGLQVGDLIHSFAGVEADGGLQAIGAVVQRSEGVRSELAIGCHADDDTGRIGASSHARWQQEKAEPDSSQYLGRKGVSRLSHPPSITVAS